MGLKVGPSEVRGRKIKVPTMKTLHASTAKSSLERLPRLYESCGKSEGLDRMRIKANGPNWWGNGGFDGLDASKRKFSRDGRLGDIRMG
jgi:hypothetical protein